MSDEAQMKVMWERIDKQREDVARIDKTVGLVMHDVEAVKRDLTGFCGQLKDTKTELAGKMDFLINKHYESEGAKKFAGFIKGTIMFVIGCLVSGITIYKFFGN